jgi:hypothetical protein
LGWRIPELNPQVQRALLTASQAPRPRDQHSPAAALSALSAASILPVGGMATVKTSNGCGTTIRTACKFDICKSAAGMVIWKGTTLKKGPELVCELCFSVLGFFLDLFFCPFSLLFAAFWSWKLTFQLLLELFM